MLDFPRRFRFRPAVVTWSGGIDSTALLAAMATCCPRIIVVQLDMPYGESFARRERAARDGLRPSMDKIAKHGGCELTYVTKSGKFLTPFETPGKDEIRMRNRKIIDFLIAKWPFAYTIGMGEYVGADTWKEREHVTGLDCDSRALGAYLYENYGLSKQLVTLDHFGSCRFKDQRLSIGLSRLGAAKMALTTNCLRNTLRHCGNCYKCWERHAAFQAMVGKDPTRYTRKPPPSKVAQYREQFLSEVRR